MSPTQSGVIFTQCFRLQSIFEAHWDGIQASLRDAISLFGLADPGLKPLGNPGSSLRDETDKRDTAYKFWLTPFF